MDKQLIIDRTVEYVRQELEGESSGHDWWHVHRVWNMARRLAREEGAYIFVVEMASLLHDVGDKKLHGGDESVTPKMIDAWLDEVGVGGLRRDHIQYIVKNLSYSAHLEGHKIRMSRDLMVVQDADRLDAMGAIGVGRTFAFGGHKGNIMYHPKVAPNEMLTKEEYDNAVGTTVNHFYEKLLKLKDLMNTDTAKKIAEERHTFMETFLERFYKEWEGNA